MTDATRESEQSDFGGRWTGALRRRLTACTAAGTLALIVLLAAPGAMASSEYKPTEAGHPLRIVGYVVHPIGVVFDYVLLRPAFWIGSHEPFRTLFGRKD